MYTRDGNARGKVASLELVDAYGDVERCRLPADERAVAIDRATAIDEQRTGELAADPRLRRNPDQRAPPLPNHIDRHSRGMASAHRARKPEGFRRRNRDKGVAAVAAAARAGDLLLCWRVRSQRRLGKRLSKFGRLT